MSYDQYVTTTAPPPPALPQQQLPEVIPLYPPTPGDATEPPECIPKVQASGE